MIWNCTPDNNFGCSPTMLFDNSLWQAALTCIASNTNTAIMVLQIEAWFILQDNLVPSVCQALCSWAHCWHSYLSFFVRVILYKGTLACRHRRSWQWTNVLLAAWRKLYGCQLRMLMSTSSFPKLFSTRRSTASKLVSLLNCSIAGELLLLDREIPLLEGW